MLSPPDSSIWVWGEEIPYTRIDSIWMMVDGEETIMVLGPDTEYFPTEMYDPDLFIFRPEVFGPYPPGSDNDPIWYLSEEDTVRTWVFNVRVDRERSTRYVALPEDPEEELSEPVKTYFEILPSNFLSSVGANVEEIQYLVRGPDSTTIEYGPIVLDRGALAASGGEGVVEWNGRDNNGQYVEASEENENYRSKIPLFYHPTEETRDAVSSELKMNGRDGNSEKALRFEVIRMNVTDGNIVQIGGQQASCQNDPPILFEGHFDNQGELVIDRLCPGGFEIKKEGPDKVLRIELEFEIDAWKQRPSFGEAGMSCEVHWEIEDIGEGDIIGEVVDGDQWVRKIEIGKDINGYWDGLHYIDQPDPDCFGSKTLWLEFKFFLGQNKLSTTWDASIVLFFEKGPATHPNYASWVSYDDDSEPNWFEYWKTHNCVHNQMHEFQFRISSWERGGWHQDGEVFMTNLAAVDIPAYVITDGVGGGEVETFFAKRGIDWCAEIATHELAHKWVWENWQPGGQWHEQSDTDRDGLPDNFEINTTGTDPNHPDTYDLAHQISPAYSEIGDQELYVRMQARDTFALDYSKDWANRGKQTDPQW